MLEPSMFELLNRRPTKRATALLLILCLLFFLQLGNRELASSHEARAGQNAQSMLNSGCWDLPRLFDGRVEMQKPPLFYWLVALFGLLNNGQVDAWCVRLPAALAASGCVFSLFGFGVLRGRPLAGFLGAVMLATFLHFTSLARIGRIDMTLTLTVSLSVVGAVQGWERYRQNGGRAGWRWFLVMYVALAAGVMLKGPIAFALLAVVVIFLLASRERKLPEVSEASQERKLPEVSHERKLPEVSHERKLPEASEASRERKLPEASPQKLSAFGWWWGVPLVLLLTLPWFLHANAQTDGAWFRVFFWYHNVDRGLGTEEKLRSYPFWFYGPQLLADLLPWSLLLPGAAWYMWRRGWRADREARLGALWLIAMLLLLSCMRFKRADYLLPAYPGAALLLGCTAEQWYRRRPAPGLVVGLAAVLIATTVCWLGYLFWAVPLLEESRTYPRFAAEIRRHSRERILFFRAEAHTLALHVGQPQKSLLEWENLDVWVGKQDTTYVVLPPEYLEESAQKLGNGRLEVVVRSQELAAQTQRAERSRWLVHWLRRLGGQGYDHHERPLVLVRTRCGNGNSYIRRM